MSQQVEMHRTAAELWEGDADTYLRFARAAEAGSGPAAIYAALAIACRRGAAHQRTLASVLERMESADTAYIARLSAEAASTAAAMHELSEMEAALVNICVTNQWPTSRTI